MGLFSKLFQSDENPLVLDAAILVEARERFAQAEVKLEKALRRLNRLPKDADASERRKAEALVSKLERKMEKAEKRLKKARKAFA